MVAIQGGGVFGLSLIGQLQAVVEDHRYVVLALAGTSAGAIVATLYWAGLAPSLMRKLFAQMATSKTNSLIGLLGPLVPPDFDLHELKKLIADGSDLLESVTTKPHDWYRPGNWIPSALKAASLIKALSPHYQKRGFFAGEHLESQLDLILRAAMPGISKFARENELVRFSHVTQLIEQERSFRPPLLLTVTNLTKKSIEIISSIDPKYSNVPVAKAVRASAGYPVFFTPQEIKEFPGGGWFVDGGLISNFPIWTFSEALREEIQKSNLEHIYGHLVNKPWIRVGLRIIDDTVRTSDLRDPKQYFLSLGAMLTGGTRNELEEILAKQAPRSIVIKQPYSTSGGPDGFLCIKALDAATINKMVENGRQWADAELKSRGSPGVISDDDSTRERVTRQLEDLVQKCNLIFGAQEQCRFRSNVFMPVKVDRDFRMRVVYSFNMEKDGDRDMEFPDLQSGATGFCYWSRRPQVCNLERIAKLRNGDSARYSQMFGMPPTLQRKVSDDRTWLASVPIFDPHEVRIIDKDKGAVARRLKYKGLSYIDMDTEIAGPLLGVLNLDAGWSYDDIRLDGDPNGQLGDKRVQAVLAIMQSTSFGIARSVGGDFPQ